VNPDQNLSTYTTEGEGRLSKDVNNYSPFTG